MKTQQHRSPIGLAKEFEILPLRLDSNVDKCTKVRFGLEILCRYLAI